jgi:hypothetical protein
MLSLLGIDELTGIIGGFALAIIGGFVAYWRGRVKGASNARQDATLEDYEHAQDIRRRVDRDRADRVRKLDDAGYRD